MHVYAVYQLEEMWELIRSLPSEAVASLVDQTRKRLSHKSPVVKQKVLRAPSPRMPHLHALGNALSDAVLCFADLAPYQVHLQQRQLRI